MRRILVMAMTATFFSGCGQKIIVPGPKAQGHVIDAKTKPLPSRTFGYYIAKKGEVLTMKEDSAVLSLGDARWYKAKMNRCVKNGRKLEVALDAANEQIKVMSR